MQAALPCAAPKAANLMLNGAHDQHLVLYSFALLAVEEEGDGH